jgi:4-hydroxy-2-oxoheptanedioate aldolase
LGSVLTQPATVRSALIWAQAGLDFIVVDTEHPPVDRHRVGELTAAFACVGVTPLVRIASRDPDDVHRTLDAGAHGILVPYCETRAQVQALVDAVRLRPIKGLLLENGGRSGESLPAPAQGWGRTSTPRSGSSPRQLDVT